MSIADHDEVSKLLLRVLWRGWHRLGVYTRLDAIRSELDEWVQREYTVRELPQEKFHQLYYPSGDAQRGSRSMSPIEAQSHVARLLTVRGKLTESYPDCGPRRSLLRKLDGAAASLRRWGALAEKSSRTPTAVASSGMVTSSA